MGCITKVHVDIESRYAFVCNETGQSRCKKEKLSSVGMLHNWYVYMYVEEYISWKNTIEIRVVVKGETSMVLFSRHGMCYVGENFRGYYAVLLSVEWLVVEFAQTSGELCQRVRSGFNLLDLAECGRSDVLSKDVVL